MSTMPDEHCAYASSVHLPHSYCIIPASTGPLLPQPHLYSLRRWLSVPQFTGHAVLLLPGMPLHETLTCCQCSCAHASTEAGSAPSSQHYRNPAPPSDTHIPHDAVTPYRTPTWPPGDLCHTVFGASKDFCGSGLRIGALYSKNAALNQALGNLGYFASVPAPLQHALSRLWADDAWLDGFLAENGRRMLEAYTTLTGGLLLQQAGCMYEGCCSALMQQ